MINLIRRIFIKDYKNTSNEKVREKHGLLSSIFGILTNLILFIMKILVGIFTFSMSIISDAINNLTDLFSCIFSLIGFKIAAKPADKRHPYGHERVEYVAGLVISFVIISAGIVIGYTAIQHLIYAEKTVKYSLAAFIILGVSILAKILLGLFYKGMGKAINSESLRASMFDSFCDSLCTTGVLIAALINYFVPSLTWLDPAISLVVAIFILYTGFKSSLESVSPLIGVPVEKALLENIKKDVLNYPGVFGIHDLYCHTYGHTKIYAVLHVEVDGYQTVLKAHQIIDEIETDLEAKYNIDLTIHMDPIDTKNSFLNQLKNQIETITKNIDSNLTIHDLQENKINDKIHVSFDILKDDNCKINDETIIKSIKEKVESLDSSYVVTIKLDYKYN